MKKYFLVIDQGTTGSRIVLYNKKFEIFDIGQKEFKQYFPNEGWVAHNATEIWDDVRNLISNILRKNKLNSKNLIHAYGPEKKVLIMPINDTLIF